MSQDLLDRARALIGAQEGLTGVWPKAVAFLTRQALEEALADIWNAHYPGMANARWSTQLACLNEILSDSSLMADVRAAWASLSRACHHHHYELDPTAAELDRWIRQTERLVAVVDGSA